MLQKTTETSYKYIPKLSEELETYLKEKKMYASFVKDYNHLCTQYRLPKITIIGKEEKNKPYEKLSSEEKEMLSKHGKTYAHALHQLLELAMRLDKEKQEYALIGGFGILGHLYEQSPSFIKKFRGTEDIDILSKNDLESQYRSIGFKPIPQERINLETIPDKQLKTYITPNPHNDQVIKIQDRKTIALTTQKNSKDKSNDVHKHKKQVIMYGVPVWVASAEHLIASKQTGRARKDKFKKLKDEHDILQLDLIRQYAELLNKQSSPKE